MLPNETDVLIVGAGPTGLALAASLQQAGVRYVLIDKLAAGQNTSRAAVVHAHTLDMLETDRRRRAADRARAEDPRLPDSRSRPHVARSPVRIAREQARLRADDPTGRDRDVLSERLTALGGTVHRGHAATAVSQSADGVEVTVTSPAGEQTIRARYVVGGDGMHSVVREAAGIAFEGERYEESFVLADIHMDWALKDEVSLFFSEAGLVVVAPLPGGAYRVVATLDHAPERPQVADIQALIDARGPRAHRAKVKDVIWSSRFRVHHRLAAAYRNGRIFVMGDAAHVHSPAGGQGMNCGLVDACVLGQLLADVIRGRRTEAALDLYETLRRPAAAGVLALAGRLTMLATMRGKAKRVARNALFWIVNHIGPAKRALMMNLSGLARQDLAQLPALSPLSSRTRPKARAGTRMATG